MPRSVSSSEGDRGTPLKGMRQLLREVLQAVGRLEATKVRKGSIVKKCASLSSVASSLHTRLVLSAVFMTCHDILFLRVAAKANQSGANRDILEDRLSPHPSLSSLSPTEGRRPASNLMRSISKSPSHFRSLSKLNPRRPAQSPLLPLATNRASQSRGLDFRGSKMSIHGSGAPEKSFGDLVALVLSESQGDLSLVSSLSSDDQPISSLESSINSRSESRLSRRASEPGRSSLSNVVSRSDWATMQGRRRVLMRIADSLVKRCRQLDVPLAEDVALAFVTYTVLSTRELLKEGTDLLRSETLSAGEIPLWQLPTEASNTDTKLALTVVSRDSNTSLKGSKKSDIQVSRGAFIWYPNTPERLTDHLIPSSCHSPQRTCPSNEGF